MIRTPRTPLLLTALIAATANSALAAAPPRALVIAHRGLSGLAPESTEVAHRAARMLGADYLEGDLHRTADCQLVIFHDDTLDRTTDAAKKLPRRARGGEKPGYEIGLYTLAELKTLDAGKWFNAAHPKAARSGYASGEPRILTLDELVGIATDNSSENRPGLYLEFKSPAKYQPSARCPLSIEEQTIEQLRASRGDWFKPQRLILQSFDRKSIRRLGEAKLGLTRDTPKLWLSFGLTLDLVTEAKLLGADGIGPAGALTIAQPTLMAQAFHAGLFVHPFTLNTCRQLTGMQKFLELSSRIVTPSSPVPNGVFTDRADLAINVFRNDPQASARATEALKRLGF